MGNKTVYTFDAMIASLRLAMREFPDNRTGRNTQYAITDAALGAFSVFFTQCPSFLAHQKLLEQKHGLSNAKTLFGMRAIPSNNHIRNLLDRVDPSYLSPVFADCLSALSASGDLDTFRVKLGEKENDLLLALDGTLPLIVSCGRARWKIENENNNTLKRQGYNLEHNFGHGKKYLASILATMNILAFLFHTMLEFMNKKYQLLRKVFGARKRLFESIRVLLIYHPY